MKYCNRERRTERFVTLMLALVFVMTSVILISFADHHKEQKYMSYIVRPGDTLWKLADEYGGNYSIREVIEMIRMKNRIIGSTIYAGDIVLIPILE